VAVDSTHIQVPGANVPNKSGQRILVLDDEPSILEILGQHLTEGHHHCVLLTSPYEALERIEREDFALLITDLKMPEMHGIEVLERAKKLSPDIAVIVVTAMMDVTNAIDAMRAGAYDYVLKPFNLAEITFSVEKALDRRRLLLENRLYQEELELRVRQATEDLAIANRELRATKDYLENLLHSSIDAILTVDVGGAITYANLGALRMLGYHEDAFVGQSFRKFLVGGAEEGEYLQRMLAANSEVQNYETEIRKANQEPLPVNISMSLVKDASGKLLNYLAIFKDITAQKRLEADLKEMSIKDSLSGLYNQRYFFDRLESEIERARRQGHPLSMLLFDVDQFKSYNDTYGHLEGDRVLHTIGQVVLECTREHVDIGFRYGGDEFTVILPEAAEDSALQIAERIRSTFEQKKFDKLTLSVGLMSYQAGQSARSFMHFADKMMYSAKRQGGNRVYIHRADGVEMPAPTPDNEKAS